MDITKEMDSFDVFHLREDATNDEIQEAFKMHVMIYCGRDGNNKTKNGEYLVNIYQYHYKRLMNLEEKKKLIEERNSRPKVESEIAKNEDSDDVPRIPKNELLVLTTPEERREHIITSLNQEIIQKYKTTNVKIKFSLKKYPLKNTLVIVGSDSSLLFANEVYCKNDPAERKDSETGKTKKFESTPFYLLRDCFTNQDILGASCWPWFNLPWEKGKIFEVNGVPSTALLGSKVFPHELIHNGKIKDGDFRRSYDILSRYIHENTEYISSLFEEEQEEEEEINQKKKKKKK